MWKISVQKYFINSSTYIFNDVPTRERDLTSKFTYKLETFFSFESTTYSLYTDRKNLKNIFKNKSVIFF